MPLSLKTTEPPVGFNLDFVGNCASFDHNSARINAVAQILDDAIAKAPLTCSSEVPDYSNTRLSVVRSTHVVYSVDSHGVVEKINDRKRRCGKLSDERLRHLGFVTSRIVRTGAPYRPGGLPAPGYVNVCFIPFSVSATMIAMTPREFRYSATCLDVEKTDNKVKLVLDIMRTSTSHSSNDRYCKQKAVDEENIRLEISLWSGEIFIVDRSGNLTGPDDTCGNIHQEVQKKIDAYLSRISKQLK